MISNNTDYTNHPYIQWRGGKNVSTDTLCSQIALDTVDTWKAIEKIGFNLYKPDQDGFTPFHYALFHGNNSLCHYFTSTSSIAEYPRISPLKLSIIDYAIFRTACSKDVIASLEEKRQIEVDTMKNRWEHQRLEELGWGEKHKREREEKRQKEGKKLPSPWCSAIKRAAIDPNGLSTLIECAPFPEDEAPLMVKMALKTKNLNALKLLYNAEPYAMARDYDSFLEALEFVCTQGDLAAVEAVLKAAWRFCHWSDETKIDMNRRYNTYRLNKAGNNYPTDFLQNLSQSFLQISDSENKSFLAMAVNKSLETSRKILANYSSPGYAAADYNCFKNSCLIALQGLLKEGADLEGLTALIESAPLPIKAAPMLVVTALKMQNLEALKFLYDTAPYNMAYDYQSSRLALEFACAYGDLPAAESILKARWKVKKFIEVVKEPFRKCTDLLVTKGDHYPLHLALQSNNQQLIDFLLGFCNEGLIWTEDIEGNTPLIISARKSLKSTRKILAKIRYDYNTRSKFLSRPIKAACQQKNIFTEIFLRRIANALNSTHWLAFNTTQYRARSIITIEPVIQDIVEKSQLLRIHFITEVANLIIDKLIQMARPVDLDSMDIKEIYEAVPFNL